MQKDTMTPRERWMATLMRKKADRVPMSYRGTAETTAKIMKHLECPTQRALFQKLHIDEVLVAEPDYIGPPLPPNTDIYGCQFQEVAYGTGSYSECCNHPLASFQSVEEIEANYTWPSADWFDFRNLAKQTREWETYPVRGGGSEPFLIYKYLRGDEQAFLDLLSNPEIVHYCMGKMYGFRHEFTRRIFESIPGRLTHIWVAEDLGSQEDLLYSVEQIKTFFLPHMRKMIELAHDAGAFVFHHSDGAIRKIIPALAYIGMDVLDPIQWRCPGMEREGLKNDFGKWLIFHGGVDNQQTLPFGTVEDVRNEVLENLRILGGGGQGYILGPCHNIQVVTPPENIVALYEAGYEHGWL